MTTPVGQRYIEVMTEEVSTIANTTRDADLNEIEDLVQEVANLSKADIPPGEFYSKMLDRVAGVLAAAGGAVWTLGPGPQPELQLEYQINLGRANLDDDPDSRSQHDQLLKSVLESEDPTAVPPRSNGLSDLRENGRKAANPTDFLLLLCPIIADNERIGIVEILQRPGRSPQAQSGFLSFLGALCELAADFHRNHQLRQLRDRAGLWGQFEQFAERVHGGLDLDSTAYAVVNDGRHLIGCDRLSLGVFRGRRFRVLAMSGLDTVDRRANLVRDLQRLVKVAASTGEELWYEDDSAHLPPQIEKALNPYLDESHARMLAILPLRNAREEQNNRELTGALIVERFETDRADDSLRRRTEAVCRQTELALANALEYQSIPLLPLLRLISRMRWYTRARQLPKTAFFVMLFVATILALVFVPGDFEIEGRGELQPRTRREVFAGSKGVVAELLVDHKQTVAKNDLLVKLRDTELDFEFSRVLGEIQTAQQELVTVHASRLGMNPTSPEDVNKYNELTAREQQLKELVSSLEQQRGILEERKKELEVRSPITGRVLTWKVEQLLESRPVQRGDVLMTVADLDGDWVLEIHVPDDHIGHVLTARRELQPELDVSFVLQTDPSRTFRGTVQDVAMTTEIDEKEGPTVLVTVKIDRAQIPRLRPGATVIPKIYCGREPIGYVWFHELYEAFQKRILF